MSKKEITRVTNIYEFAIRNKDWQREIECLSALRVLYAREGDHEQDVRRITNRWKVSLEKALKEHFKDLPKDKYEMYRADRKNCYKFESEYLFESFIVYMEWERPIEERFYQPRRATLKECVDWMQDLEDGVLDLLGIAMPPRAGKSSLGLFFCLWVIGRHPNKSVFMSGHTTPLMKSFYDGIVEFSTSDKYNYKSIFPASQLIDTDAKGLMLDFGQPERYKSISFRSIDSAMSGFIEASSLLIVDDLIQNIEEARKPDRISNAAMKYETDIKQRRKGSVPTLIIGTCWSINDPMSTERRRNVNNKKAKFINIPALNDELKSNFDYPYGVGFSTEFYLDTKRLLDMIDPAIFASVYQQKPIESEGVCFHMSELKRFDGTLPRDGKLVTATHIDVAWGGGDSTSAPIGVAYDVHGERRVYVTAWVFTRADKDISESLIEEAVALNSVQRIHAEANNGGDMYAKEVEQELKMRGYRCEVTWDKADNQRAKVSKILAYAPDIKQQFYFLNDDKQDQPYRIAMAEFTSWLRTGESPHDDAPDSIAGLSEMILGKRTGIVYSSDRPKGL